MRVVGVPHITSHSVSYIFLSSSLPSGLGELKACPFPNVVFPPFLLSALSSPRSAVPCEMVLARSDERETSQKVFIWPDCLLDLDTDFLVDNVVFVWDGGILR